MVEYHLGLPEKDDETWSASYIYPRKYWMDVRVDWNLKVGLLPARTDKIVQLPHRS